MDHIPNPFNPLPIPEHYRHLQGNVHNEESEMPFKSVGDSTFICKTCGEEVESGISNISDHWANCNGKNFHNTIAGQMNCPVNISLEYIAQFHENYSPNKK